MEVFAPHLPFVRTWPFHPVVLDFALSQGIVNCPRSLNQAILRATTDPEESKAAIRFFLLTQDSAVGSVEIEIPQGAAERPDPGEPVEMPEARAHGLAAAHGKTGYRPVLPIGERPEFAINKWHQVVHDEV